MKFQTTFCSRFNCSPAEYEAKAFKECLYWHARLLAPVLQKLKPDFFAEDFKFVRNLSVATTWREAREDVLDFRQVNARRGSFLRTALRIRVSGRKASRLAQQLFALQREVGVQADSRREAGL